MNSDSIGFLILGMIILIIGAELFVRGASKMAAILGISPLVVGLTVVAFGTSSPEIAVGLQASLAGNPGVAIGNVIGSNITNVLLILGLSAVIMPLTVASRLIRFDVPIMIGVSILFLIFSLSGGIGRIEGLFFLLLAIGYTSFVVIASRKESKAVRTKYEKEFGPSESSGIKTWTFNISLILLGLGGLVVGADWLVESAVALSRALGISDLIIGLTVVAVGTSLPEIATSVIATIRGEREIVIGNIIGSNIYNILLVLGSVSLITPGGLPVPSAALNFDIPVMLAVAIACLPIFITDDSITRWEGFLFLGYYIAYILYLVLAAQQHAVLPFFNTIMLTFVIPLTVLTLFIVLHRSSRQGRVKSIER